MAAKLSFQQLVMQVHICTIPIPKCMHTHNPDTAVHCAMQCAICSKQCAMWRTCTYTWAYTSTVQTAPANQRNISSTRDDERVHRERRQTCSPRETTNVFTARDDKQVHREKQRTCSPRETTNVFTARDDERVHRERRRTCSPRETTNEFTARNDERVHRKRRRMWLLRETTNVNIEFIVLIVSLECESVLWREVTRHNPKETGEDSF